MNMTNQAPLLGQANVDSFFPDLRQATPSRAELYTSIV